jgi:hypothetical protein
MGGLKQQVIRFSIGFWIYNLIAGGVGGIELELIVPEESSPTP